MVFELEDNYIAVLQKEAAFAASTSILRDYGIPSERSLDLLEPYTDITEENKTVDEHEFGDIPASNSEFGFDGILWV